VEVVLAMALLGIAAVVIMTAASRCLAVVRTAKNYYTARHVLDLGELDHPLLRHTEEGKEEFVNLEVDNEEYENGFTFSRTAEESEAFEGLYIVKTRVAWSQRGRQSAEEVITCLFVTNTPAAGSSP
jgi:hypothetical protein